MGGTSCFQKLHHFTPLRENRWRPEGEEGKETETRKKLKAVIGCWDRVRRNDEKGRKKDKRK